MSLICLCASHIDSTQRIKYFGDMIRSWDEQLIRIPLHVSMSYELQFKSLINHLIDELHKKYKDLYINLSDDKISQFNHYKLLCNKIAYDKNKWLIFTDDDDIWQKTRTTYYANAIEQTRNQNLLYIRLARHCENIMTDTNINMTANSSIDPIFFKITDNYEHAGNYIEYCCTMETLNNFINKSSEWILSNYFADVLFVKYLRINNKRQVCNFGIISNDQWIYFYRKWLGFTKYTDKLTSIIEKDLQLQELCSKYKEDDKNIKGMISNMILFSCYYTKENFNKNPNDKVKFFNNASINYNSLNKKGKVYYTNMYNDIINTNLINKLLDCPTA